MEYELERRCIKMKQSTYKYILEQYRDVLEEIWRVRKTYLVDYIYSKKVFKDNEKMRKTLRNEVNEYLENPRNELKIYNFLLKNERKLYAEDIHRILDSLQECYESRYPYIKELFENFETAIGMNLDYKFYLPKHKPEYIGKDTIDKYKLYAKGFNLDRVTDFLIETEVYSEETLDSEMKKVKQLDVDAQENIDMFGIYENGGIVLPRVRDELSACITIHELVHNILLLKKEEIKESNIIYGEDLPVFYELLYQKTNSFARQIIHTTEIALKLLESYNEEPLSIQIEKVKKYITKD